MNIYVLTPRFALLWTCLLVAAIAAGADAPIAIEHVTVIEVINGNTKPDTTIVITGSRITGGRRLLRSQCLIMHVGWMAVVRS